MSQGRNSQIYAGFGELEESPLVKVKYQNQWRKFFKVEIILVLVEFPKSILNRIPSPKLS